MSKIKDYIMDLEQQAVRSDNSCDTDPLMNDPEYVKWLDEQFKETMEMMDNDKEIF